MGNKTLKKVLATALATVLLATTVAPTTVEASAKKDKTKPTVKVKVINASSKSTCVKNSKNTGTFKKGWHTLKTGTYYSVQDMQIKISDTSGIKSIRLEGTVRDLPQSISKGLYQQCRKRTLKKTIKIPKGTKKYTFKLSENINKKSKYEQTINDGEYKLTVVDRKNNKRVIKFVVDTQAPLNVINPAEANLKGVKKVIPSDITNNPNPWLISKKFDALSGLDWIKYGDTKVSAKSVTKCYGDGNTSKETIVIMCDKAGNTKTMTCIGTIYYK